MEKALVGLSDAIEALRVELTHAVGLSRGARMRFTLEPVELTVQAVVTKEGDGRLGWKVLSIGGSYESARTQTVTLRLTPRWFGDDDEPTDFTVAVPGRLDDVIGPHD